MPTTSAPQVKDTEGFFVPEGWRQVADQAGLFAQILPTSINITMSALS